jgi:hypothetical protein
VTHLRKNVLDDTGGQGVDWASYSEEDPGSMQLRWENEELVANVNEAIRQVYRRINPVQDVYLLSVQTGIKDYTLPSYVRKVLSARRADGKLLKEKSILDYPFDEFDSDTGELYSFIPDQETNKLRIYPEPIANEVVSLHIYRFPKVKLSWDNYDSSPELREEYQIPMLNYAAFLCYMKDEANTYDPSRASLFNSLFDREFPFTSAYSNVRKARTVNRPVRYGGL